jgi:hypothetical protein
MVDLLQKNVWPPGAGRRAGLVVLALPFLEFFNFPLLRADDFLSHFLHYSVFPVLQLNSAMSILSRR